MHGLGSNLNVYAYVSGKALRSTDPFGLDGAKVWSAFWQSVRQGDLSPSSKFAQALVHEDYGKTSIFGPGESLSSVLQNDRALKVAQDTIIVATVGAEASLATGGAGGNLIVEGAAGGMAARGTSAALSGGGAVHTAMAATSPSDVASDTELTVVVGGALKASQVGVKTARQGVTASATAPPTVTTPGTVSPAAELPQPLPIPDPVPGRIFALDANAFKQLGSLRTSGLVGPSDTLVVTPNVQVELARNGMFAADIKAAGVTMIPDSPLGAAVPASKMAQALRGLGGPGAKSAAGDALNLSEAAGVGADAFITRDAQVMRAFGGTDVVIPHTGGVTLDVIKF